MSYFPTREDILADDLSAFDMVAQNYRKEKEARTLLDIVSELLPAYMEWADVWHRQAGGYTASDTAMLIWKMERLAKQISEWKQAQTEAE